MFGPSGLTSDLKQSILIEGDATEQGPHLAGDRLLAEYKLDGSKKIDSVSNVQLKYHVIEDCLFRSKNITKELDIECYQSHIQYHEHQVTIPFELLLPFDIPSSFQSKHAAIRHLISISLQIVSMGKRQTLRYCRYLLVESFYTIPITEHLYRPFEYRDQQKIKFGGSGRLYVKAQLKNCILQSGKDFMISSQVINESDINIDNVKIHLVRSITHFLWSGCQEKAKKSSVKDKVVRVYKFNCKNHGPLIPAHQNANLEFACFLPSDLSTIAGTFLKIDYSLVVTFQTTLRKFKKVQVPIIITQSTRYPGHDNLGPLPSPSPLPLRKAPDDKLHKRGDDEESASQVTDQTTPSRTPHFHATPLRYPTLLMGREMDPWRRSLHAAFTNTLESGADGVESCNQCPPCLLNLPCSWEDDDPDSFIVESEGDDNDALHESEICSSSLPTSTAAVVDYGFEKFTTIFIDQDRRKSHVCITETNRTIATSYELEGLEYYFQKEHCESIDSIDS